MTDVLELALENQRKARELVASCGIVKLWEAAGIKVNQVGSLRTGLLMKHRDIDFHVYSDQPSLKEGLEVMRQLAATADVRRLEFRDLLDTPEVCLEYHVWVKDRYGDEWQLDIIHIKNGSHFDGWFEKVADRIIEQLTPETRLTVLTLKNETPEDVKIMGIEYCQAVLRDGIRTYAEFTEWRKSHPPEELINWMP